MYPWKGFTVRNRICTGKEEQACRSGRWNPQREVVWLVRECPMVCGVDRITQITRREPWLSYIGTHT